MANNNSYFITSGFISFSLFALCIALFMQMMFGSSKIDAFALKKDNYISVSIEITPPAAKKKLKSVNTPVVQTPTKEEVKDVNIDDLFSDVWTKKIKKVTKKKKKIDTKRLQQIQKKIKVTKNNSVKSISKKVNEMESLSKDDKNKKSSTGDEVNEYLAKIQALVYRYFYPPQKSEG